MCVNVSWGRPVRGGPVLANVERKCQARGRKGLTSLTYVRDSLANLLDVSHTQMRPKGRPLRYIP